MQKKQLVFCSIAGALGVTLGALGAHKLQGLLSPGALNSWETAVQYHMIHVLAMLVLALSNRQKHKIFNYAFLFFALGIVFFSGSLYFLSLKTLLGIQHIGPLGFITPLGGLFFIIGWLTLILHKARN